MDYEIYKALRHIEQRHNRVVKMLLYALGIACSALTVAIIALVK